jgi:hypothetical protein
MQNYKAFLNILITRSKSKCYAVTSLSKSAYNVAGDVRKGARWGRSSSVGRLLRFADRFQVTPDRFEFVLEMLQKKIGDPVALAPLQGFNN